MSKPRWARRGGKWCPVETEFWQIWHANKDTLKNSGYTVRLNENGQWEVRYLRPAKRGWPPYKPVQPIFVPAGKKASICFRCGHVKLINVEDEHKDCTLCGGKINPD